MLAGTFLFAGLSSLALPGMSPFISEFALLAGTFGMQHKVIAVIAVLGIVLAAAVHPADVPAHDDRTGPGRDRETQGPERA